MLVICFWTLDFSWHCSLEAFLNEKSEVNYWICFRFIYTNFLIHCHLSEQFVVYALFTYFVFAGWQKHLSEKRFSYFYIASKECHHLIEYNIVYSWIRWYCFSSSLVKLYKNEICPPCKNEILGILEKAKNDNDYEYNAKRQWIRKLV